MRGRVLAGVQAGTAAVAEVGEVMQVGRRDLEPGRHGGEHHAAALAVAAGIADLQLPRELGLGRGSRHQQLERLHARPRVAAGPPAAAAGPAPARPEPAATAAAVAADPARRPSTVPIVMPTQAM
jgi:hypothetical protein